nr:hypothetical protein [uncultured Flavobacterium sp.]
MDIQATKIKLAKMILETEDISLIEKMDALANTETSDFYDDFTEDQKLEIQYGIEQLDKGESMTWEEFRAKRKNRNVQH